MNSKTELNKNVNLHSRTTCGFYYPGHINFFHRTTFWWTRVKSQDRKIRDGKLTAFKLRYLPSLSNETETSNHCWDLNHWRFLSTWHWAETGTVTRVLSMVMIPNRTFLMILLQNKIVSGGSSSTVQNSIFSSHEVLSSYIFKGAVYRWTHGTSNRCSSIRFDLGSSSKMGTNLKWSTTGPKCFLSVNFQLNAHRR